MDWREKVIWVGLGLVLISWGLEIYDVWPVLVDRLTPANWLMVALIHPAVLLSLIGVYANTPKGNRVRSQVLLATVLMIISWSTNLSLLGKIGSR